MKRLLIFSGVCAIAPFYAMEKDQQLQQSTKAIRIKDILTPIYDKHTNTQQELGVLLRYPSEAFKKTDIVIIDTIMPKNDGMPGDIKKITKQGKLDSLTCDNINDIARGFACYHPYIKKSHVENDTFGMDVGTIAIDLNMTSSKKADDHLVMERNVIFAGALQRKIEKKKNEDKTIELFNK